MVPRRVVIVCLCLCPLVAMRLTAARAADAGPERPAAAAKDATAADPSGGKGGPRGTFRDRKIKVGGQEREYRLVVPESVSDERATPLVFAFHGLLDSKDLMPFYSKLDKLAEKEGFILAFPNGRNRHWPLVVRMAQDDLAFFDALYDQLAADYNIDRRRVFLTGMSNGAYFCHLVASQRPDTVAAIAAHSGGLGLVGRTDLEVPRKYAVLLIHGETDALVQIGESRKARDAYNKWGHAVELIEVPGLNHFWAHKIDINDRIWKFFSEHPLSP
jgi:polyhydroxybutyrate depolymerase